MLNLFIALIVGFIVGIPVGMLVAFVLTARDKSIVRLNPDQTIVVKDELLKLIKKARLNRGVSSDEEEEEEENLSQS